MSDKSLPRAGQSADSAWRGVRVTRARLVRIAVAKQIPLLMACSIVVAGVLLLPQLNQGWFPHDDGSLAQSADRVLNGELPQRDFIDLYTGGLSFFNAAVFAVFGEDAFNLRLPLFVLFLGFIGCFFALARRVVPPLWAFVAALFAATWTVPVYPAPMPSWYVLFLSTFGTYAVVRFFETGRRRWLLAAGLLGGLSIIVKIVGVWYVVAVVLALLGAPFLDGRGVKTARRARLLAATAIATATAVLAFVLAVVGGHATRGDLTQLVLPIAALCIAVVVLGARGWRTVSSGDGGQFAAVGVFGAGVALPIAAFLIPYLATGSVGDLIDGALIAPQSRFEFASVPMPETRTLAYALPVVAVLLIRTRVPIRRRTLVDAAICSVLVALVAISGIAASPAWWKTIHALAPIVLVIGAVSVVRRRPAITPPDAPLVLVVVLVAGFGALVQFPFATPVYFCYAAPLVLLAALAGLRRLGAAQGALPAMLLLLLVIFGYRALDYSAPWMLDRVPSADPQVAVLDRERASIRVTPEEVAMYHRVQELVEVHRAAGKPIFAGPDAPEVYFLTSSRNPTRVLMDFLDRTDSTRGVKLLRLLSDDHVPVVVVNHDPNQSSPLAPSTISRLRFQYPRGERVDRFEVRWRDAS